MKLDLSYIEESPRRTGINQKKIFDIYADM